MTGRRAARLASAALLLAASTAAALEVPYLGGRVNDLAGMLSDGFETRLASELAQLERDTGAQVVVLTVPSLEGDAIEDFAMRAAETWKLGHAGVDNGVLVVIARDERLVRIEVGYGLEGALTDVQSGRIIRNLMTPRFRAGDFDGGVAAAVGAIATAVRGEPLDIPDRHGGGAGESSGLGALLLLGLFGLPFINAALGARGAAGWILYLLLAPFFFIIPAAFLGAPAGVVAAVAWLVAFPILRAILPRMGPPGGPRARGRGGVPPIWIGGPGRGGGFGGGGLGGGGFGGFGGGFGGGGATGGW